MVHVHRYYITEYALEKVLKVMSNVGVGESLLTIICIIIMHSPCHSD